MDGPPTYGDPQNSKKNLQVADGGHVGNGKDDYLKLAERLRDNGYEPLPIIPNTKRPAPARWATLPIGEAQVEAWSRLYPGHGIGLRTGYLVGLDIDVLDPDTAHEIFSAAVAMFGHTLIRVGRWPKQLLLYRTTIAIRKLSIPHVEILGAGQQFVAFGRHPDTKRSYDWVTGESPCEVPLDHLPVVDEAKIQRFLAQASALTAHLAEQRRPHRDRPASKNFHDGPTRGAAGLVVDGRDGWLSKIAFHTVHHAIETGEPLDPHLLARRAWDRFAATTDLARAQKDGSRAWSLADALRKVGDKLQLQATGRLLPRGLPDRQPDELGTLFAAKIARAQLSATIGKALEAVGNWWNGERTMAAPVTGIRATVGLGKSAIARAQIADWQRRMKAQGFPHRVLLMTPSHVLADEAAVDWAIKSEGPVAVLRGYEASHPVTREPMCRNHELVRLALRENLNVGKSVCKSSKTWQCRDFEGCLKQQNKRDVAEADVVLAPYDVLFTGLGAGPEPFGLMVIDEGCWQRAEHTMRGPSVEKFGLVGLSSGLQGDDPTAAAAMANLTALRTKARVAFLNNGPGLIAAQKLEEAGLSAHDCEFAAALEERCILDPGIYPGMKPRMCTVSAAITKRNETARRLASIWRAMAEIISGQHPQLGLLRITAPDPVTEEHGLVLHDHLRLAVSLASLPILHLDATLRPDLANLILPGLQVTRIEAEQPHLHLTLVVGHFGKSTLCPSSELSPKEQQRRRNRLREVVDHVRWQARRIPPGLILVVTHKGIERAFAAIEGVQTAHFNAIAGLDQYRDIRLLIVVGRPLPSSEALTTLTASFFHKIAEGKYLPVWRAVHLRSGGTANLRVVAHEDPQSEILRAAICDDEVIQAIGRGRGVNRAADDPLEVQVLADVALPMVHDDIVGWESLVPSILQKMLLAGVAVDSPADAAALYPKMFRSAEVAKKAFQREVFGGHYPIDNSYRDLSLKSARYRKGGRGRSAYWLDQNSDAVRKGLEAVLGTLEGWEPFT